MNIKRIGTAIFMAALLTAFVIPAALVATPAHAVVNTFQQCDLIAGVGGGTFNWYRPNVCPGIPSSLTLQGTLTSGAGGYTTGASFDVASCDSAGVTGGIPNPNPGVPCLYATYFSTASV